MVCISLRNVSAQELTVTPQELMERFTRGDSSRSTEGSGLGLAIAKSFVEAQGGSMKVEIEGDIFARADAPVFDSVASVQSYARYMSFAETEKDIFNTGGEDGDAAAVLGDLSRNPALQELIKP